MTTGTLGRNRSRTEKRLCETVLEVDGLSTYFFTKNGVVRAVDDLNFTIGRGEILGIVGESGSGKSVTGLSILGLLDDSGRIVRGSIRFRGRDLTKMSRGALRQVRGASIGMIFQDPMTSLNPVKRIASQIVEAIRAHSRIDKRKAFKRSVDLLRRMSVPAPENAAIAFPHQFSGGMRQRVVIAIGSANQPELLIADEPTTALDVTVQREILTLLRDLATGSGTSMMLITHNLGVVAAICDRVAVMYAGEIVESGPAEKVLSRASHPYTQSLLNAVPRFDHALGPERRLVVVDGSPPSPGTELTGCRFLPRCRHAIDKCAIHPELLPVEDGHASRCWVAQAMKDPPWLETGRQAVSASPRPVAEGEVQPLLLVEGLSKSFGTGRGLVRSRETIRAVDEVSLSVAPARTLGLVGESGSGKSTVARMITRLIEPSAGRILFDGTEITGLAGAALTAYRSQLQMIFQDPYASLNPRMTVFETVAEAYRFHHPEAASAEIRDKVADTIASVGLDAGHLERYPHEFSGGQRQRIGIARSLVVDPRCIIADEPVSALDVNVQGQIINLLTELQEARNLAYMLISHDLAVVRHICDDVAVMYLGRIVERGPAELLFRAPRHHYTRLLIDSAPIPDVAAERARQVRAVPGEIPNAFHRPSGCAFRTRCPAATRICAEVVPELASTGDGRAAACHHPLD